MNRELVLTGEKPTDVTAEVKIKLDDIVEIYGEVFDDILNDTLNILE